MMDPDTPAVVEPPPPMATTSTSSLAVALIVTSPAATTSAPWPMNARTSFVMTSTSIAAPTPALPLDTPSPPAPLLTSLMSDAVTEMSWAAPAVTSRFTRALVPIDATVVSVKMSTTTAAPTAAVSVPTAPPIATEPMLMLPMTGMSDAKTFTPLTDADAATVIASVASMSASAPIVALVVIVNTFTATAAPTAVEPSAPERARFWRPIGALAATLIPPGFEVRVAPSPTVARLSNSTMLTPMEAPTLTSLLVPPAAAMPHATISFVSPAAVTASTAMPWPVIVAPPPIVARLSTSTKLKPTAAPTFAFALLLRLVPIAFALASVEFVARTMTAPEVPVTVRPAAIEAAFFSITTFTAIEAATPTPEFPEPDWLVEAALPWSVPSLAFGSSPPSRPLVEEDDDGVFLTWSFACLSASLSEGPPESSPDAPALVEIALAMADVAVIDAESPVTLRSSDAVVVGRTMATPIAAPTATSPPPAWASDVVRSRDANRASMTTAPLAARAVPLVPSRALVVVIAIVRATAGLTATPPSEPALVVVSTVSLAVARIVTSSPPVTTTPSATSARVTLVARMLSATAAPTPTSPPLLWFAPACAMSLRLPWATIEM